MRHTGNAKPDRGDAPPHVTPFPDVGRASFHQKSNRTPCPLPDGQRGRRTGAPDSLPNWEGRRQGDIMTTSVEARKVTAGLFSREAVTALSRARNEPDWLLQLRLSAWEAADRLPYPTGRERAWKYLDPNRLKLEQPFYPVSATGLGAHLITDITPRPPSLPGKGVNVPPPLPVGEGGRGEGSAIICTLDAAVRDYPELVRKHLGSVVQQEESVFTALNAAFWTGGVLVYAPRDTKVEAPIEAVLGATGGGATLFPRVLIVAEQGAEVIVVDQQTGGDGDLFICGVTELVLAGEAKVQHYRVQRWGPAVQELHIQRAELGRSAQLLTAHAALGGSIAKGWVESRIRGSGANSEILGLTFGAGGQYIDFITLQDHIGDHTTSDLLIKSALADRSQSAYYGLTRVQPTARMAQANQEDRNLLLSDKAKAEADPVLEILTSEVVRCAHGASAGPVDQEQLFYLECRGLPRPEAERLLVQGFLGQVLGHVPVESVRELISAAIDEKLAETSGRQ